LPHLNAAASSFLGGLMSLYQITAEAMETIGLIAGSPVKYYRGSDWVQIQAVGGKTDFTVDDGNGFFVKYRSRDFILKAEDLKLSGVTVIPLKGDTIVERIGSTVFTYEVLRPDGGEQVYRFSDHGRTTLRIHCKLKGSVPA
jgi:hypothetical protein